MEKKKSIILNSEKLLLLRYCIFVPNYVFMRLWKEINKILPSDFNFIKQTQVDLECLSTIVKKNLEQLWVGVEKESYISRWTKWKGKLALYRWNWKANLFYLAKVKIVHWSTTLSKKKIFGTTRKKIGNLDMEEWANLLCQILEFITELTRVELLWFLIAWTPSCCRMYRSWSSSYPN